MSDIRQDPDEENLAETPASLFIFARRSRLHLLAI